jgi:pyruvate kinase
MVKAKIICTLGPASGNATVLRKMMLAGMDVVRLNFSHGTHEGHLANVELIRQLNKKYRRRIRILHDLEGFRIRIGTFDGRKSVTLKKRQQVILTNSRTTGGRDVIPFDYDGSLAEIRPSSLLYIDDGRICLEVTKSSKTRLAAKVLVAGEVKAHKGVNIPDVNISFAGLTEKDKRDLDLAVEYRPDFIAQSFVRTKKDLADVRSYINSRGFDCKIIAKIENHQGIRNIDGILEAADGVMIARGDMGVSLPIWEVPIRQKELVKKCRQAGKLVIVATQMLETMTDNVRPTRAEVSDVANAILDGADCCMLSGETAVGHDPIAAVNMMNQIIKFTEHWSRQSC